MSEKYKKLYKPGLNIEDVRKERDRKNFKVRKDKIHHNVQKRRNIQEDDKYSIDFDVTEHSLLELEQNLFSVTVEQQLEAAKKLRMLLSMKENPPIQEIIDRKRIVPCLVQYLQRYDSPQLQLEVAWSLTNIASGEIEHTSEVVNNGAIPQLISLLRHSTNDDIKEQVIWALGNIAGDCIQYRDNILESGVLDVILEQLGNSSKLSMLRNATWTVSNLCRGKPNNYTPLSIISKILPHLCNLIYKDEDSEVVVDSLWGLCYISEGTLEYIEIILNSGICKRIVELLMNKDIIVKVPALKVIGNILTGNAIHTQLLINLSILPCLASIIEIGNKGLIKEACWAISNITAGNVNQIAAVIEANIIPNLISLLSTHEFSIRAEAAWAISNICSGGLPQHIRYLVFQGCLKPLCDLLDSPSMKLKLLILDSIEHILKNGELECGGTQDNPYICYLEEVGGIDKIESVCNANANNELSKRAEILLHYCNTKLESMKCE